MNQPKFKVGDRVLYQRPPNYFLPTAPVFADMGLQDRVMHLNAKDQNGQIKGITGRILSVSEHKGQIDYSFQPDGWEGENVRGFVAPEDQFMLVTNNKLVLKGTITDRRGNPVKE